MPNVDHVTAPASKSTVGAPTVTVPGLEVGAPAGPGAVKLVVEKLVKTDPLMPV